MKGTEPMTTSIHTNLNGNSVEYERARPRLQQGLDNIAAEHNASGLISVYSAAGMTRVTVEVRYRSGACLRDVVAYLDEMQVLD
jgi:hypothetical protein